MHYLESELNTLLREDRSIFEFLESESLDGMWFWDLEKPGQGWMGPGFWRLFGIEPETRQHLVEQWHELIHPEDLAAAKANFEAHLADPSIPYDHVVRVTHADGSTVWVRCRGKVIRNEGGQPMRMLGVHTDLTEVMVRQAELSAFIEALPGVAMILDADGMYVKIMSTRERLLADSLEQLLGKRVGDVLPPESAKPIMATVAKTLETGEPQLVEYKIATPASVLWFEGRVVPLPQESKAQRPQVIWLAHDITDRKVTALDLERRNADLRQFAHVASHDLRSPLHTISQLTSWLEEDCGDQISDEGKEFIRLIQSRTHRMGDLIEGLLRYAKTSGTVNFVETDTGKAIEAALEMVYFDDESFTFDVPKDPPTVVTDPLLFQQIVQNLVGNSIKHHDKDHGHVVIQFGRKGKGHLLSVTDDGPGIPPEFSERVFQVFQTLKSRDVVEASGIGLAIVKKAVDGLGGTVTLESDGKSGTTFHVFLPDDAQAAKAAQIQA